MKTVRTLLRDDAGASAIEYGLIATSISIVIAASVWSIGETITTVFERVGEALTEALPVQD